MTGQPLTQDYQPENSYDKEAVFTASTTSAVIDLSGCKIMGIITPASLGATILSFQAALTAEGTYLDVNDQSGAAITVTVSTSAAGWADLTSIFPASVRFLKIKANASITKTLNLATTPV